MAEGACKGGTVTADQNCNEKVDGRESNPQDFVQQPGQVIVPDVPDGFVEKIAKEMFGFQVIECKQLNSYMDKNYHIRVSPTSSNPHVTSLCSEGYVMKVVNALDSKRPALFDAQFEIMRHFRSHGITTQEPVPSVEGESIVFYDFPSSSREGEVKTHAVCLRTFIPGITLTEATLSHDLCYKVGVFIATITKALEDFHHPFYNDFENLWSMEYIPKMKEFVHCITDVKDRRMVDDVIERFSTQVLPRRGELRKGYIHGDPNEQNILVRLHKSSGSDEGAEYVIAGILDFDMAARTHPLYDLAIAIAYSMTIPMSFDPLEVGGHILAGYTSVLDLPAVERSVLSSCVAARLGQSLVMGMYSFNLDPSNEYVLATSKCGWHSLRALWTTPAVEQLWDNIQRSYTDGRS